LLSSTKEEAIEIAVLGFPGTGSKEMKFFTMHTESRWMKLLDPRMKWKIRKKKSHYRINGHFPNQISAQRQQIQGIEQSNISTNF
jgi:hypothetical protein